MNSTGPQFNLMKLTNSTGAQMKWFPQEGFSPWPGLALLCLLKRPEHCLLKLITLVQSLSCLQDSRLQESRKFCFPYYTVSSVACLVSGSRRCSIKISWIKDKSHAGGVIDPHLPSMSSSGTSSQAPGGSRPRKSSSHWVQMAEARYWGHHGG